nr:isoform 2 of thymidylate kinase [Quercus suber]
MENTQDSILSGGSSESRGALVVLEGLDRSGKTSQSSRLLSYLEGLGHSAELWRFLDRSTDVGQMISSYLSNKSQLDDHTIHLLFSANHWEKRSLMETKLKIGTTLIVNHYFYSGVAFSSAKGLGVEWCKALEVGLLAPDLVLYLDIQPEGENLINDASIKSKKVIARSRACTDMNVSANIKDRKTSVSYSKSEESLTTKNLADIPNGKFQFKSQPRGQVGNSIRRKSGGNSVDCDRGNSSKSNTSPGMVQSQATESLEMDIPLNATEYKDGLPATHRLD